MLMLFGAALILDSRCAAEAARDALCLCARTLVPSLFPLFVISGMLVHDLQRFRMPPLSRLLGVPDGGEGIWVLGLLGGFPVGAAAISQAVEQGCLSKKDGERMLGLCSLCGPPFLLGVLPGFLPMSQVMYLFVLQLQTSLLMAAFWPGKSAARLSPTGNSVTLPSAVRRAVDSVLTVCAWVVLAGVVTGLLRRWLFPLLPDFLGILLTGFLELTTGIFTLPERGHFLLCTLFVCFGGISVLLQIGGMASAAGLSMKTCIAQKSLQGLLGCLLAWLCRYLGPCALLFIPTVLLIKITVEIPGKMMYNVRERKGSPCYFVKRSSAPASTAATARP